MVQLLFGALLAAHFGPMADVPARQPQLAVSGNTVALAFGAGKSIYLSTSADRGNTFGAPVRVAEVEVLPLGRHRGPRVALSRDAIVVTAVAGRRLAEGPHAHGLSADGDLLVWRSRDG